MLVVAYTSTIYCWLTLHIQHPSLSATQPQPSYVSPQSSAAVSVGRLGFVQSVWVAGEMVTTDGEIAMDPHCHSEMDLTVHDHPADAELWLCEFVLRGAAPARAAD